MSKIGDILNYAILSHPSLLQDLPGLLSVLDSGKQIILTSDSSSDPSQQILSSFLKALPTKCSNGSIWTKGDCNSLKSFILSKLLESNQIIQPQEMTPVDRLAFNACKKLILILEPKNEQRPDNIISDLISLLESIMDGEGVDISGLDNLNLKENLITFFRSLELEEKNDDDGGGVFQLREDEKGRLSQKAIKIILLSLRQHSEVSLKLEIESTTTGVSADTSSGEMLQTNQRKVVGPTRNVSSSNSIQVTESSSEDEGGPVPLINPEKERRPASAAFSLSSTSSSLTSSSSLPLGIPLGASGEMECLSVADGLKGNTQLLPSAATSSAPTREEWLLTPGERKPFGGGGDSVLASALGNRKFERGKQSKKAAEILNAESEREYAAYLQSDEGQRTEELLREHREKRGPALVERHQENNSKKSKTMSGSKTSRFFDRERDLLSHRQMDKQQVESLIDNAKQLDSRFSKTAVQRSFL